MNAQKLTDPTAAARLAVILAPALRRVAKKAATSTKVTALEVDRHDRDRTTAQAA